MAKFDTQKHTLHLRSGDFDFLSTLFAVKNISASHAIRTMVSQYVDNMKLKMKQMEDTNDV